MTSRWELRKGQKVILHSTASIILLLPFLAAAQLTTSVIRGHVSDSSAAAIVGAKLKIINTETNVERSTTTNTHGDYEAPDLQRGTYRLALTQPGSRCSWPTTLCSSLLRSAV